MYGKRRYLLENWTDLTSRYKLLAHAHILDAFLIAQETRQRCIFLVFCYRKIEKQKYEREAHDLLGFGTPNFERNGVKKIL